MACLPASRLRPRPRLPRSPTPNQVQIKALTTGELTTTRLSFIDRRWNHRFDKDRFKARKPNESGAVPLRSICRNFFECN